MTGAISPPLQPVRPAPTMGEIFARILTDLEADRIITVEQITRAWLDIDLFIGQEDRLISRSFYIINSLMRNGSLELEIVDRYLCNILTGLFQ